MLVEPFSNNWLIRLVRVNFKFAVTANIKPRSRGLKRTQRDQTPRETTAGADPTDKLAFIPDMHNCVYIKSTDVSVAGPLHRAKALTTNCEIHN
jgi:hypothetical protein